MMTIINKPTPTRGNEHERRGRQQIHTNRLLAWWSVWKGEGELSCAGSAPDPRILLRAATQTKLNVDYSIGSRGPGTNEGDYLLRPHLAEIADPHRPLSRKGL